MALCLCGEKMEKDICLEEAEELKNKLSDLERETEHLRRQVKMVANLRFCLSPNSFSGFKNQQDVDVYADQIGVAHVDGDFFDVFRIDDDHLGILVVDIFEGGDNAALFMVAFKLYFTSELYMNFSPEKLMEVTNNRLARNNEDGLCMSAWYGVYEISTGKLYSVNAGHEAPLILRGGKAGTFGEDCVCYLMGVMEGIKYTGCETYLEKGDVLLVYTDGLTKVMNERKESFSADMIKDTLESCKDMGAEETIARVQKSMFSFLGKEALSDDATLVCLKRGGA